MSRICGWVGRENTPITTVMGVRLPRAGGLALLRASRLKLDGAGFRLEREVDSQCLCCGRCGCGQRAYDAEDDDGDA